MNRATIACIDAENAIVDCNSNSNKQKKRSIAWDHFEKLPTPSKSGGKAKCKHCNTVFTATSRSGTSHLNRHVERCSKRAALDVEPILVDYKFRDSAGSAQGFSLGKKVSKVWHEYELFPATNMSVEKAKCKHCKVVLSAASKNGTSHLKRHLDRCTKRASGVASTGNMNHYFIPGEKLSETSNSDTFTRCATPPIRVKPISTHSVKQNLRVDQDELRRYISVCIIEGSYPFSLVEEKGFRSMMSKACPEFMPFSRAIVRNELYSMYVKERNNVKEMLAKAPGRISLTVSNWKARDTSCAYICVAAHFIDDSLRLSRKILSFKAVSPPNGGTFIADELEHVFSQYSIERKTFAITMDEASYNDSVVTSIKRGHLTKKVLSSGGSFLHISCFVHLLNNLAQCTLKLVDDILDKLREMVKYVNKSPPQRKNFYDLAERTFQLQERKILNLDHLQKWNSTCKLIDRTLYYRDVFRHLVESSQELSNLDITIQEWQMLSIVHKFLKVLYDVIRMFSVTNYPTANLFLKGMLMVHCCMMEIANGPNSFLASAFKAMKEKLDDFWCQNNLILSCAAILDPRKKVKFVEYCYLKLHDPRDVEDRVCKVLSTLYHLFGEYKQRLGRVSAPAVGTSSANTNYIGENTGGDLFGDYDQFLSSRSSSLGSKSELDLYLEEPCYDLNTDLDVLEFWSKSSARYRDLSVMAKDILSLPVSTVNSKVCFSAKTLSSVQSSMMPETLQALLCLQDWLGASDNSVEDASGSSEDDEYDDEEGDSILTASFRC